MTEKNTSHTRIRRLTQTGICAAAAMVLSYVEVLLPPVYAPLPAVKCGLANIAVIFALYRIGKTEAALVAAVKVLLSALLFGSLMSFAYSAAGAILSYLTMLLMMKIGKFSPIGVSIAGGVMHNCGQILAAAVITSTVAVAVGFPILAVAGTVAGLLVGAAGAILIKHVKL